MLPTLSKSGDYIFIDKISPKSSYRNGKVVIAKPQELFFPNYELKRNYKVCKRIIGVSNEVITVPFLVDDFVPQGYVWLQGDNIFDSIDSRDYGPVPLNDVNGIVRFKVKRKENL
ncbi:LexA/Signal peptidase [Neocallimastix californiae]|uniref:LexA/Signal peptidase n=1 Tax=Neocallimastix californiae TaxID=1754190 RepID=A0A1Y2B4N3_9FUNG|nr:LexA/Signal peptidase [Neocallimastix californiae]|eukprot:ORY29035.1 LexA/Signal peptidase [Neocallimastix californiae]